MKVIALTCPQCGGSQDVSDNQHLLECRYCRTILRVERSANGELERLLIEARLENAELAVENRRLKITNAIHRLDAAWAAHRPELLVPGKKGPREPSNVLAFGAMLVGLATAAIGVNFLLTLGPDGFVGIAFIGMGVIIAGFGLGERGAANRYKDSKIKYDRRRRELSDELANVEAVFGERSGYEDTTMRKKRLDNVAYPAADA